MPSEDGYSLIRKVRASQVDTIRTLPAIAMTAFTGSENRDKAIQAGFSEFMPKPIDIAALSREVHRLVAR
jgi:CheY-like chemotaxis protein